MSTAQHHWCSILMCNTRWHLWGSCWGTEKTGQIVSVLPAALPVPRVQKLNLNYFYTLYNWTLSRRLVLFEEHNWVKYLTLWRGVETRWHWHWTGRVTGAWQTSRAPLQLPHPRQSSCRSTCFLRVSPKSQDELRRHMSQVSLWSDPLTTNSGEWNIKLVFCTLIQLVFLLFDKITWLDRGVNRLGRKSR